MQLVAVDRAHFISTNHKARCYCNRMLHLKLETQNQPETDQSLFKIRKVKNISGTAAMIRSPVRLGPTCEQHGHACKCIVMLLSVHVLVFVKVMVCLRLCFLTWWVEYR